MRFRVIIVPYVLRNDLVFLQDGVPWLTDTGCIEYLPTAGSFKPTVATIVEEIVVIVPSDGCFWLTN